MSNFILRGDGFQFDSFTLTDNNSVSIGNNILSFSSVVLTASDFNVTFGTTTAPAS